MQADREGSGSNWRRVRREAAELRVSGDRDDTAMTVPASREGRTPWKEWEALS